MADDPQVVVEAVAEPTAPMQDTQQPDAGQKVEQPVTQQDIARLQRKYDRMLASAQKELDAERRSRKGVEEQLTTLLDTAERKFMAELSPEKRLEWTAQQEAKKAQRLSAENQGLRKQMALDRERDKVLKEYGLRGNEDGLDYSNWKTFTYTAAKLHALKIARDKLNEFESQKSKRQETVAKAQEVGEQRPAAAPAPIVDTRGAARMVPSSGPLTDDDFRGLQMKLTRGNASQRQEALKALRERREAVRAA